MEEKKEKEKASPNIMTSHSQKGRGRKLARRIIVLARVGGKGNTAMGSVSGTGGGR